MKPLPLLLTLALTCCGALLVPWGIDYVLSRLSPYPPGNNTYYTGDY